jgi:hypothetical protein
MADVVVRHAFTSAKADGVDSSLVQPSQWNANHSIVMATNRLAGRATTGTGSAEEVSLGTGLTLELLAGVPTLHLADSYLSTTTGGTVTGNFGVTGATTLTGNLMVNGSTYLAAIDTTSVALATAAELRANTPAKLLSTNRVWNAAAVAAWTPGQPIDFGALGWNLSGTASSNFTLPDPTNAKSGQSGVIIIQQDGTGGRTITYAASWVFPAGTNRTLSTAPGARDVIFYFVASPSLILCSLAKGYS